MIREDTLTVLRAVRDHGPITTIALTEMGLTGTQGGCKPQVNNLVNVHGLVEPWDFEAHRQRYVISMKGERLLKMMDAAKSEPGQFPAPRTAPPSGRYEPAPWMPPRGEASMLAFRLPSLHCGETIPRVRPALIAGRALEAVGVHGLKFA
jgi:hypothetical protein